MSRNVGSYTGQKHPRSRQRHGRTNGHPDLTPAHVRGSGNPNPSLPRGPGEQQRPQRGSSQYSTGSVGGRAGQPMDPRTSGRDPFSEGDMDEAAAADAVTDGSTRPTGERTWQRGSSFSYMPPNEQKRQKLQSMSRQEEEQLRQYRESQGTFQSVSQRLGSGHHHSDLQDVRDAQQRKARIDALTKSVRDKERRETYRAEMRRKEEEEARRHKEKQRLKTKELELKKEANALACREATRSHWQDRTVNVIPGNDTGCQQTPPRGTFPSQNAKHRQYRDEQRKAEAAEYARHKASQRAKAEFQQARAEEEGKRVQEEVRRSWGGGHSGGYTTHSPPVHATPRKENDSFVSPPIHFCTCGADSEPEECVCSDGDSAALPKSALATSSKFSIVSYQDQDEKPAEPDRMGLSWPSNQRPASLTSSHTTDSTADIQHLTECQATLCSLGIRQLSLSEIKVLLKANNNNLDRVACLLLKD